MSLISHIQTQMICDDADPIKESERIIHAYQGADADAKRVVDDIFISLTGWSLATLIKEAGGAKT